MGAVSFVFQDDRLFKRSLAGNVRAGRPDASDAEVLAALHAAQCDDIIAKFPDGVSTVVGKAGVYLSGGECQRIALARAILKGAPIVVLDALRRQDGAYDCTSSVNRRECGSHLCH